MSEMTSKMPSRTLDKETPEEMVADIVASRQRIAEEATEAALGPSAKKGKNLGVYLTPAERAALDAEAAAAGLPVNRVMRAAIVERVRRMRSMRERRALDAEIEREAEAKKAKRKAGRTR